MKEKRNGRNATIDVMRCICAILVIAIHTHPLSDINETLGYLCSSVIPAAAVPFFFAVSGFYTGPRLNGNWKTARPIVEKLLRVYVFWSLVYFTIEFFRWGYSNPSGFAVNGIIGFAVSGSYYHLWFFPALIYSVILTSWILRVVNRRYLLGISLILYMIGCLGCSYYGIGSHIPMLRALYGSEHFTDIRRIFCMGFPFYVCGMQAALCIQREGKKTEDTFGLCMALAAWAGELGILHYFGIQHSVVISPGLYLLVFFLMRWCSADPLTVPCTQTVRCQQYAGFAYYSHPLIILVIRGIAGAVFGEDVSATVLFFMTIVVIRLLVRWFIAVIPSKIRRYLY